MHMHEVMSLLSQMTHDICNHAVERTERRQQDDQRQQQVLRHRRLSYHVLAACCQPLTCPAITLSRCAGPKSYR